MLARTTGRVSVPLHHTDLGGADKPPMIVLHGLLGSARNWQTAGRDLAEHYHVFALDARNHGKSPQAPLMTYDAMVGDILAWMDAKGIARAVLVGHSMGGKTAMRFACLYAKRVERLVVVDIAPKDYSWIAHRGEFAAMNELDLTSLNSRQEAELRFEARVPSLGMRKFMATNLDRGNGNDWHWAINLPVLTEALPAMERNSLKDGDRFAGPALFIAGGRSNYVQADDHATIRQYFPSAHIAVIAESGHNPHMDQREEFVRLVRNAAAGR